MLNGRVRFDSFEADLGSGELWRERDAVPIQDLPFRLLAALLERPGEVVTRAELTTRLWGSETFVDAAAGLNTAVAKLREALDDDAEQPRFIETVPKRGYRFIAAVEPIAPPIANAATTEGSGSASDAGVSTRRHWLVGAATFVTVAIVGIAAYQLRASREQLRVAVVLFDNETGKPELGRLAQGLTDATVTALAADPRLAVIGNAAVLRTARPFRDIALVRDALNADFIVIGQVQSRDADTIVRAHLIRAKDQAHVWVAAMPMTEAGEAALQSTVSARVASAVSQHTR